MPPPDLRRISEGHYADTLGRGRLVRLVGDSRWVAVRPTGQRSPIFSTMAAAHEWLKTGREPERNP